MSEDKTVVCLVCGKKFPRGILDLARHTTAITLQHLISRKPKTNYDFHCAKCELYFKSKSHLELHAEFVCQSSSRSRHSPSTVVFPSSSKPKVKKEAAEEVVNESEEKIQEDRTMECMVCGKLFPRGPIDLARHATAVTLRHLVNPRHTAAFHHGCKKCGLHFSTAEHLVMHTDMSSCNEDMVWPTTVTPGCRCLSRADAAEQDAAEAATASLPISQKIAKESKKAAADAAAVETEAAKSSKAAKKAAAAALSVNLPAGSPPLSKYMLNKLLMQQQAAEGASTGKRGRDATGSGVSSAGVGAVPNAAELYVPKVKRPKVIIPEDRKAFFAVVSVLIDPATVPEGEKLTEDNYEAFLPAQHKRLLDVLKANLYCTC